MWFLISEELFIRHELDLDEFIQQASPYGPTQDIHHQTCVGQRSQMAGETLHYH